MSRLLMLLGHVLFAHAALLSPFSLLEMQHSVGSHAGSERSLALYPLPAVYLPGTTCTLRNVEPRNIAMAREQSVFVASLVSPDRSSCARVGTVLRIDEMHAASADTSGQVLASPESSRVLQVECTAVERVELVRCDNLEAWTARDTYLMAEVVAFHDDEPATEDGGSGGGTDVMEEAVEGALFRLVDALLESERSESTIDVGAAVDALEATASHVAAGAWWAALELWQRHCATRTAAAMAQHQAERHEVLIDAALRQGGPLQLPVREASLPSADRRKLYDLDRRNAEALGQVGLDDAHSFQACLEATSSRARAQTLLEGVEREARRLAQRAALQRALDASS